MYSGGVLFLLGRFIATAGYAGHTLLGLFFVEQELLLLYQPGLTHAHLEVLGVPKCSDVDLYIVNVETYDSTNYRYKHSTPADASTSRRMASSKSKSCIKTSRRACSLGTHHPSIG